MHFTSAHHADVPHSSSLVCDAIDNSSGLLVVTDADLGVLHASRAFLRMIELESLDDARGCLLTRWIRISATDLRRMREQMAVRGMPITLSIVLHVAGRARKDLQALAIAVPHDETPWWGFSIAERPRLN